MSEYEIRTGLVRRDEVRRRARWMLLNFLGTLTIMIALALAAQAWLVVGRVYWTGAEEARTTRQAWSCAWERGRSRPQSTTDHQQAFVTKNTDLQTSLTDQWPGLPVVLNGLALRVRPDPLVTPRALAVVFSLVATAGMLLLAQELFLSRTVTAAAGLLAALHAPRALLGVLPLPEVQLAAWLLPGLACALRGLRRRRVGWHVAAAVFFILAMATAPWAWIFGAAYALALGLREALAGRRPPWWIILVNATALGVFITLWVLLLPRLLGRPVGALEMLANLTGIHSVADIIHRFQDGALMASLKGNALQLNLLGLLGAAVWLWRERWARSWMAIPLAALAATLTRDLLAREGIPAEAAWRTAGLWGMLLIPFTAAVCVLIAPPGSRAGRALGPLRPLLPLALFVIVASLFARELILARQRYRAREDVVQTGKFLAGAIGDARRAGGQSARILIEPEADGAHWNIAVLARDLGCFIDEYQVAAPGTGIPPYRSEEKRLFAEWLRGERVRWLVFRTQTAKKVIFSYPGIGLAGDFGAYTVFEMK